MANDMPMYSGDPREISPAEFDQMHAAALKQLRKCNSFFLVAGHVTEEFYDIQTFVAFHVPGTPGQLLHYNAKFAEELIVRSRLLIKGMEEFENSLTEGEDE